ncbi:hypothetical protein QJS10_CPA06g01569 [Acorus calamus]|uniref:Uncharacterized protein n=1 Tax=Acorus calamus TaxID=4465 RepID=A0AAV9ENQ2_ACOCL|nr:hypothetical protein QJS10_CPA06g01569 [Acorus calamus]
MRIPSNSSSSLTSLTQSFIQTRNPEFAVRAVDSITHYRPPPHDPGDGARDFVWACNSLISALVRSKNHNLAVSAYKNMTLVEGW